MYCWDFDWEALGVVRSPFAIVEPGADKGVGVGKIGYIGVGVDIAGVIIADGSFLCFRGVVVVGGENRVDLLGRCLGGRICKIVDCIWGLTNISPEDWVNRGPVDAGI